MSFKATMWNDSLYYIDLYISLKMCRAKILGLKALEKISYHVKLYIKKKAQFLVITFRLCFTIWNKCCRNISAFVTNINLDRTHLRSRQPNSYDLFTYLFVYANSYLIWVLLVRNDRNKICIQNCTSFFF